MVNKPQEVTPSLEGLMNRAARALEEAGVTVEEIIDALPEVGNELMRREYGDAFVDELEHLHAARRT